jgi:hypothetical protein
MLDALSLRRTLPTVEIRADRIKPSTWSAGPDPIFTHKYLKFLKGDATLYMTRVSLEHVKPGFYCHTKTEGLEYRCDDPPKDVVMELARTIREGHRPSLHLYGNINESEPARYLCPDDVATYRAYTSLGMKKVPAAILNSHRRKWEESAIGLRVYPQSANDAPTHVHVVENFTPTELPGYISDGALSTDFETHVQVLRSAIEGAKLAIKEFHLSSASPLHYHHTLYSTLIRLDETLHAVRMLARERLWYQAAPLIRTLYETSLNFYLDWLVPEQMHAFFALSSVLTESHVKKFIDDSALNRKSRGSKAARAALKAALDRTFSLVRTVKRKAQLSPLGDDFYQNIYSFLSRVAHQDFEIVANYAHTLERDGRPEFNNDTMLTLIRFADLIVAKVVTRILDDIGELERAI